MSTDTKLLAAQEANKRLRAALNSIALLKGYDEHQKIACEALATPDDTAELDALIADADRWSTVEMLWYLSGDPLEIGTTDEGGARIVFDGAESAGAVWEGNDLSSAIDSATAAMKEAAP